MRMGLAPPRFFQWGKNRTIGASAANRHKGPKLLFKAGHDASAHVYGLAPAAVCFTSSQPCSCPVEWMNE
jgi:hypothetical protein